MKKDGSQVKEACDSIQKAVINHVPKRYRGLYPLVTISQATTGVQREILFIDVENKSFFVVVNINGEMGEEAKASGWLDFALTEWTDCESQVPLVTQSRAPRLELAVHFPEFSCAG